MKALDDGGARDRGVFLNEAAPTGMGTSGAGTSVTRSFATRSDRGGGMADGFEDGRFGFGRNWLAFADLVDERRIAEAECSLRTLCVRDRLDGLRFLDVGSGSGLSSLAARRLGASVVSFDYDPHSCACTALLRERFRPGDADWRVERGSALDAQYLATLGRFDIVHSWGVLHHTGAMYDGIRKVAALVEPGGLLILGLYRKTRLCALWAREKRWYVRASPAAQQRARRTFVAMLRFAYLLSGRDFENHVTSYASVRGMSFWHDVHDWMGGYPYESITPENAHALLSSLDFREVKSSTRGYEVGLFGSGCDEYTYRRRDDRRDGHG